MRSIRCGAAAAISAGSATPPSALRGTLYDRYYGIGYDTLATIDDVRRRHGLLVRPSSTFDDLCRERAGHPSGWSVPANGTIIEQAQILTTHNLATLAGPVQVEPSEGWAALARSGLDVITTLVTRLHHNPRPLPMIKDAAYAWRHMIFYLSLASGPERAEFVRWARTKVNAQPDHVGRRLEPALIGLKHVIAGGSFNADGCAAGGRRFLGWTVGWHWMATDAG
jgi:hypothetical protein